jgi:hypothetical protein
MLLFNLPAHNRLVQTNFTMPARPVVSTGRSAKVKEKNRGLETKKAILIATYYLKKPGSCNI